MWTCDQAAGAAVLQTAEITAFLGSLEGKKKQVVAVSPKLSTVLGFLSLYLPTP